MSSPWIATVRAFAERVLSCGRDPHGTPLFVDGVEAGTLKPVEWAHQGERWLVCNPTCQQHLHRSLAGLSALTGEARWRDEALAAIRFHMQRYRSPCGLLQWGGHRFIDLRTGRVVGEQDQHELKCTYPCLDLMAEADAPATEAYVRALWNAHVLDWSTLDMNRHGAYGKPMGRLWASGFAGAEPFFAGDGLTFINCGSDLIAAAGWLARRTGEIGALTWAKRLARQYVRARDPATGLGAYQFSQPRKVREPVSDEDTASQCGDRAQRQLGPELGPRVLEGRVLDPERGRRLYGQACLAQLRLAEQLGEDGRDLLADQVSGLLAYARHAYDPASNTLRALLTDGTPLTPADIRRPGYYRPETFARASACSHLLLSYAAAWRLSGDPVLWSTLRWMGRGHGLGDLEGAVRTDTACDDPVLLFAVLEIHRATRQPAHLQLAQAIAARLVAQRFRDGLFVAGPDRRNASFDSLEALALLHLAAAEEGRLEAVPAYTGGQGHIHGPHDGVGRTYDRQVLWQARMAGAAGA